MRFHHLSSAATALASSILLEQPVDGFGVNTPMKSPQGEARVSARFSYTDNEAGSSRDRRDFLGAVFSASAVFAPSFRALADEETENAATLHIVDYPIPGKCGEAKVPEKGIFFAKTFGGLVDGSCSTEGYKNDEGTANGTGEKDKKRTYSIYGK
eukprot:scaffold345_cov134-Cylindrotheca_fusiformis.AAC.35